MGGIHQRVSLPAGLIYCGYIIYELGLKNLRLMRGLPTMIVVRLGVAPVVCWLFCRLFGMSGLPMSVFIVETPAGGQPGHRDGGGLWGG